MDGEQAPSAPASASEANQPTSIEAAAPEAAATPTANIPADQIESFNRFVSANGGFEKAFSRMKNNISNPQPQQRPQPHYQEAPQYQQQYQQAPRYQQYQQNTPPQYQERIPEGYITQEEFAIQQYFNNLSQEEEYAPIADKISSGEVFKDMAKFGIRPARNGMFNDGQVRDFLSLLTKTVPAQAPETKINATPTVDYYNAGDKVTTQDQALAILRQNMDLSSRGLPEHPMTQQAKDFVAGMFQH